VLGSMSHIFGYDLPQEQAVAAVLEVFRSPNRFWTRPAANVELAAAALQLALPMTSGNPHALTRPQTLQVPCCPKLITNGRLCKSSARG
jgi:hypothetical protein